jgi:hypothetical protein
MAEKILSRRETAARKGVSPATWDRQEAEALAAGDPTWPRRRLCGKGRIGYLESEVDAHLRALPVGDLADRTKAAREKKAATATALRGVA